jgi:hypothetical protein
MPVPAIRLGNTQRFIARDLTETPRPPIRYGTMGETEKIYDRLVKSEVAEKVDNPANGGSYLIDPVLYKRGKRWTEAALRHGWIIEMKQSA